MKSIKFTLATGTAAAMILAGCSNNSSETSSSESAGKSSEPYEIQMLFPIGGTEKGLNEVLDEVNKITKEKINATVKIKTTSWAAWTQQSNLQLVSGDKLDIIMERGETLGTHVTKGFLLPLDDLLKEEGKGIVDVMDPDYLKAASIDGKVYALPSIRDMASAWGFVMRKDVVDKYGIDISKVKTFADIEAVFKTVKEKEANMVPISPEVSQSIVQRYINTANDPLGDGIGVLPKLDNSLKVVNYYETDEYKELVERMRKWYQAGYVLKDAATNKKVPTELIKSGTLFAYSTGLKPGFDTQTEKSTGMPMVSAEIVSPTMTTSQVSVINFSIPKNSKNPQKTMEFLNLMYTDPAIVNLFDWGVEGKHYVKKDDGTIDYPQGTDPANPPYGINQGWMFGNQLLSHIFTGDDKDLYQKLDAFNKGAQRSKALGFTYNPEPVKTELAAINNVITQYKLGLETGTLDPAENLPKFIKALKAAGIDKVIAEKQKQLDTWAKAQK